MSQILRLHDWIRGECMSWNLDEFLKALECQLGFLLSLRSAARLIEGPIEWSPSRDSSTNPSNHLQISCPVFHRLSLPKIAVRAQLSPLVDVVRRIRIPPSPPDSLDCREFLRHFPSNFANYAHFPRFPVVKSDSGERTLPTLRRITECFFSGAPLTSPTLNRAQSEALAIRRRSSA